MKETLIALNEVLKDPKQKAELIELAQDSKAEIAELLSLVKELIGEDVDNLFNMYIDYTAKKTMVMFNSYLRLGFRREEALALTIGSKASLGDALRHTK